MQAAHHQAASGQGLPTPPPASCTLCDGILTSSSRPEVMALPSSGQIIPPPRAGSRQGWGADVGDALGTPENFGHTAGCLLPTMNAPPFCVCKLHHRSQGHSLP